MRHSTLLVTLLVATVAAPRSARAQSVTAATVQSTWVHVEPDGETGCAFDTPFRFFHHAGRDTSKLLIWFQGGGACWEFVSCSGMFDNSADLDELDEYRGIFDFANADNPFRDYSVVFIPYCTGDVHVGHATRRYGDDPSSRPVRHRGYTNVAAALRWIDQQKMTPRRIVISGASAGSYGALFWTPAIARQFPDAGLVLIGDSGVPLLNDYEPILRQWGADSALTKIRGTTDAASVDLTLEGAQRAAAAAGKGTRTAMIMSDRDAIQAAFYLISGSPDWRDAAYGLLDSLDAELPAFRSFVVAGTDHGLLRTDAFYAYETDGTRLRDWIRNLIEGNPVESRRCGECGTN
jgi:Pectinacetylesterase